MTKAEFATFAAALRTFYAKENILPNQQAMELWYKMLADIPYEIAEMALMQWTSVEKWSPSIADIREHASAIRNGDKPLWSDGWQEVLDAIRYFGVYQEKKAMDSMSELTRQTVKRLGFRNICMSDNIAADRANFRKIFEAMADRQYTAQQLPASLTNLIESVRESTKLIE